MAKTLPDLVAEIRDLMQDSRESSYRYTNERLLRQINTTFREVKRLRPDAFIGCCDGDTDMPTYEEADLEEDPPLEFPIDEIFFQSVVFHVVAVVQLSDDEFANDGRAVTLMTAFRQQMLGG